VCLLPQPVRPESWDIRERGLTQYTTICRCCLAPSWAATDCVFADVMSRNAPEKGDPRTEMLHDDRLRACEWNVGVSFEIRVIQSTIRFWLKNESLVIIKRFHGKFPILSE
jgi:hypothetical protein